jgi:hypothetical protein
MAVFDWRNLPKSSIQTTLVSVDIVLEAPLPIPIIFTRNLTSIYTAALIILRQTCGS